jgi:hypothetical protein
MTVLIPVESQAHAELKTQFEALVSRVENVAVHGPNLLQSNSVVLLA